MRGNKRLLSAVMAVLMLFTTFFSQAGVALAAGQASGKSRLDSVKSQFKSVNDYDLQRALTQKYGTKFSDNQSTAKDSEKKIGPNDSVRVIVQLDGKTTLQMVNEKNLSVNDVSKFENSVKAAQANAINTAKKYGSVRHTYQNAINGFSAVVKYKDIENLKKISGVKSVSVANMYYLDMASAVKMTKADTVWREYGLKGEGVVVAIVDTGIDYTHKDMKLTDTSRAKLNAASVAAMGGPGKFYTDKVPYGYNFADLNDRVIPETSMHGMHVSGIVGANASDAEVAASTGIKGVAPEAQLLAMKVFTNNPGFESAFNDDIAAAIDDSVRHGADVINMSLGSPAGFIDYNDVEQVAVKNATDAGVLVVVSAGNASYSTSGVGPTSKLDPDMSVVGSPGLFPTTIQVAAFENDKTTYPALSYVFGSTNGKIGYTTSEVDPLGVLTGEYSLVNCGVGRPSDFAGKDLTGKIALIKRGGINFIDKKKNAQAANAIGVIVFNNDGDNTYINMAKDPSVIIPGIFVTNADGRILLNNIDNVKISFRGVSTSSDNLLKGNMSDFSSWGTTPDLGFKPEVTAPGGQIYSTVNSNNYQNMGGTSMAAPHTAGATALVVQHLRQNLGIRLTGKEFVDLAKKLVINSAEPQMNPATANENLPFLARHQGAGLIQIDRAVTSNAYVTDGNDSATIALKEIGNTTTFKLNIKNFGTSELRFNVRDRFGVLTNALNGDFLTINAARINNASLTFDKTAIVVPAKGNVEVTVTLNIPRGESLGKFAEGFITLESTTQGQPNLGIPYVGFYGKWSGETNGAPRMFDAPIWSENAYFGETTLLSTVGDDNRLVYAGREGDNIIPSLISFSPNGDKIFDGIMPRISVMRNAKELKIQVLDSKNKVVREIAQDQNIKKNYTDGKTIFYVQNEAWTWDGKVYDNKKGEFVTAPEGTYYIRVLGKPDYKDAQWDGRLVMPVKLDNTKPVITSAAVTVDPAQNKKFNITWDGRDNTGIDMYQVYADDQTEPIYQGEGNVKACSVTLPNGAKTITILAADYAGNTVEKVINVNKALINLDVKNNTIITTDRLTVNYTLADSLKRSMDHMNIALDNNAPVAVGKEVTSYTAANLSAGQHRIVFSAVNANNDVLVQVELNFAVDKDAPNILDTNIKSGDNINTKEVVFTGRVSEPVEYLKINGQVVTVNSDLTFSTNLSLTEGIDIIPVELKDFAGHTSAYNFKFFVDSEAPVLNVVNPEGNEVAVGMDTKTYKFVINARDTSGYRLYFNGQQIGYVESPMQDGSGTDKTFEYVYNVPKGNSVVTIKAVDILNNKASEKKITVIRDMSAPEITITSPAPEEKVSGLIVNVTGRVTDNVKVASVTVNGKTVRVDKDGNFATAAVYTSYGRRELKVEATDIGGNKRVKKITIILSKHSPLHIMVMSKSINVRKGPSIHEDKLGTISKGNVLEVLGIENGWYRIYYKGKTAYVSKKYVVEVPEE